MNGFQFDRVRQVCEAPDGVDRLRQLILDLAVEGRLLPGSAKGARQRRVLTLPEVADYRIGKTPPSKESRHWDAGGIPWVSISDMEHFGTLTATSRGLSRACVAETFKYPPVPAGSLLMSFKLTVGKVCILGVDGYHNEAIISIQPREGVSRDYLMRVLPAIAKQGKSKDALMGATLNSSTLAQLAVPLPDLDEQLAIVAKLDELMALCDRLEARQQDAEAAHARLVQSLLDSLAQARDADEFQACWRRVAGQFECLLTREESVDALKQVVLSLAISGQLTDVVSGDGEAGSELAKHRIGSKGHARKGWATAALGDLGLVLGGATPSKARPDFWAGPIPWVSPKDMKRPEIADAEDHVSAAALDSTTLKLVPANSILMVVRGMILAHSFPVARTLAPVTINQDMKALVPPADLVPYLLLALQALKPQIVATVDRSSHGTCKLVSEKLWSTEIGIPPLAEQRRIVAKVTELLALCDQLKDRIAAARAKHALLADALVAAAVA